MKLQWNKKLMLKTLLTTGLVVGAVAATTLITVSCSNVSTSTDGGNQTINEKPGTKTYKKGVYETALVEAGLNPMEDKKPDITYFSIDGGDFSLGSSLSALSEISLSTQKLWTTIADQIKKGEDCTANLDKLNQLSKRLYSQERFNSINKKITYTYIYTPDYISNPVADQQPMEFCVENI